MKIFVIVLLAIGAFLGFGAAKIAPFVIKGKEINEQHIVLIKSAGLALVVIAAIITFIN